MDGPRVQISPDLGRCFCGTSHQLAAIVGFLKPAGDLTIWETVKVHSVGVTGMLGDFRWTPPPRHTGLCWTHKKPFLETSKVSVLC